MTDKVPMEIIKKNAQVIVLASRLMLIDIYMNFLEIS